MQNSNFGSTSPREHAESSSNHDLDVPFLDDSDSNDPVASFNRDRALLGDDPLGDTDVEPTSFKRKTKQSAGFANTLGLANFLSPFSRNSPTSSAGRNAPTSETPRSNDDRPQNGSAESGDLVFNQHKNGDALDWVIEGPGRRVGYEDMTAIDWIFEYTKERQRLRILYSNATGIVGYVREMADASQVWVVLVLTGIAVGLIAAGIDIASDWLGDLKAGYCSAGKDGGRFYLNRNFCCWGYEEWSQCQDWVPWSTALHVTSSGGKWFIEYFFFILYSVGSHDVPSSLHSADGIGTFCSMCEHFGKEFRDICQA